MTKDELGFANAVISLLQGVVVRGAKGSLWAEVTARSAAIEDYVRRIGLHLIVDERYGYAYLKQVIPETGGREEGLRRLMSRRALPFDMSYFLAQLVSESNAYDEESGDSYLTVTKDRLLDVMRQLNPKVTDEVKFENRVHTLIQKAVDMKFLEPVAGSVEETYEVKPLLKSFINAQWLADFNRELARYEAQMAEKDSGREEEW